MSKRHYQPFFWGDYLRDTGQLNLLEHGAYLRLIGEYWNTGLPIPADASRMRRACGAHSEADAAALDYVLGRYFVRDGEVWRHARIERDLEEHKAKADKASEAAARAANARWGKDEPGDASGMRSASAPHANQPTPEPLQNQKRKDQGGLGGQGGSFMPLASGRVRYDVLSNIMRETRYQCEERARSLNWDFHTLVDKYNNHVKDNPPRSPDRGFPAWIESFTKGKRQ